MKLPRRQFLHLAAGAAALPAVSRVAWAQVYPSRPARIVVPFPAGGGPDIIARLMGQGLSERLGQQFVIENRPGAASNIGTEIVVKAPPDGYTLLMVVATNTINATLYTNLNFDLIRDIAPVASIAGTSYVMLVNQSFPAKTVPEFLPRRSFSMSSALACKSWRLVSSMRRFWLASVFKRHRTSVLHQ